jgi:hypothetical protein
MERIQAAEPVESAYAITRVFSTLRDSQDVGNWVRTLVMVTLFLEAARGH